LSTTVTRLVEGQLGGLPTPARGRTERLQTLDPFDPRESRGPESTSAAALLGALAERVRERLERDLCPRTAGGADHLVVGIVGPNNAGKSALFNALVGIGELSPSRPTGGATRRLVGAIHPDLRRHLELEPTLARFPMRGVTPSARGLLEALDEATGEARDLAELLLVETTALPPGLLLVDTPDFDSVLRTNREVAAALLCVADVAIAVVTRHTYQNRDVVEFLREWLAHGRPWLLVYNESFDADVTRRHAATLAHGVGTRPLAVFAAPHSAAVARGEAPLEPRAVPLGASEGLEGLAGTGANEVDLAVAADMPLGVWLRDRGEARSLKRRALAASLAQLDADLLDMRRLAAEVASEAESLVSTIGAHAAALGHAAAQETMPAVVFLDAFRRVLDQRPSALQRQMRSGLRWTGERIESGATWLRKRLVGEAVERRSHGASDAALAEGNALAARWTTFHESLVRALRGPREAARDADGPLYTALERDLEESASVGLARTRAAAATDGRELVDFARTCEELVVAELDRGGMEWALQLGVDVLYLLPAFAAGAVIVHTGGLGADVAVAGGGALSAVLAERLSRLLGSGVAREARARWATLRGAALADMALEGALPRSAPLLARRARERREIARELDSWRREMDADSMDEAQRAREGQRTEQHAGRSEPPTPRGSHG